MIHLITDENAVEVTMGLDHGDDDGEREFLLHDLLYEVLATDETIATCHARQLKPARFAEESRLCQAS